ncbi:MAG: exodeoxyribonuclease VII small subunit [Halanaerobiales bacterium]
MSEKELNFEEALQKLEDIVRELEDGGLSLERSLEVFTEGVNLIKFCNGELDEAEKKIEIVLNEEDGYSDALPYDQEGELN